MGEASSKHQWVESRSFKAYRRNNGDIGSKPFVKRAMVLGGICLILAVFMYFVDVVGAIFFIALACIFLLLAVQSLASNQMGTPSELNAMAYRRDCKSIYSPRFDLRDCTIVRFGEVSHDGEVFWCLEVLANNRRLFMGFDNNHDASIVHAILTKTISLNK